MAYETLKEIQNRLLSLLHIYKHNIPYLYDCTVIQTLKMELACYFKDLTITFFDIMKWLLFLQNNNKIYQLAFSLYFKPYDLPLEFDLSSYSKIR